jgi:ABC-type nitrate/sulfonate/bicarbonate transport system permease component
LNEVEVKQNTKISKAALHVYKLSWSRLPRVVRHTMLLGALLALWQLYVTLMEPTELPGPPAVAWALVEGWMGGGYLASATWTTLGVLAIGAFVGVAIAVLLVIFATWTRIGDDLLTLLARIFDTIPAITILPLLFLWFGATPDSLILVAVYSVTWPVAINLRSGLKDVDPTIIMVGQNLGLRGWMMVRNVLLPAAFPTPSPEPESGGLSAGAPSSPPGSSSSASWVRPPVSLQTAQANCWGCLSSSRGC